MSTPSHETMTTSALTPRFRLWQLFLLIAALGLVLAVFRWSTMAGLLSAYLMLVGLAVWYGAIKTAAQLLVASAPAVGLVFLLLLLTSQGPAPEAARRLYCSNNLKQLGLALANYHNDQGAFPPAYVVDQAGKPLYSWRVLLLPYLGEQALYARYRLDEPWNSPHNLQVAQQIPDVFRCPNRNARLRVTNYVAIVGEETVWPGATGSNYSDMADGSSNTLHVIEWSESDVFWTEPRDLPMQDVKKWWYVSPESLNGTHRHGDGVYVLWADGRVSFVRPQKVSAAELRAVLTRSGNEPADQYPSE